MTEPEAVAKEKGLKDVEGWKEYMNFETYKGRVGVSDFLARLFEE